MKRKQHYDGLEVIAGAAFILAVALLVRLVTVGPIGM